MDWSVNNGFKTFKGNCILMYHAHDSFSSAPNYMVFQCLGAEIMNFIPYY